MTEFTPPDPPIKERRDARMDPRRGLPRIPVFWTLDQISSMLNLTYDELRNSYLWFEGVDVGIYRRRLLRAVNLRAVIRDGESGATRYPDWRVAEGELIRWLSYHNLWIYDPAATAFDFGSTEFRTHLQEREQNVTIMTKPIRPFREVDVSEDSDGR